MTNKSNIKILYSILGISLVSLLCAYFTDWTDIQIQNLDGSFSSGKELNTKAYIATLFHIPLIGMVLGSIFSLLPYKKLPYTIKWTRFVLITILVLAILTFLSNCISFIRYLFAI